MPNRILTLQSIITSLQPLAPVVFIFLFYYFLWLRADREWRVFQRRIPGVHFNFYITDIWAFILGMTPTLVLATHYIQNGQKSALEEIIIVMLAGGQITGMFRSRLKYELRLSRTYPPNGSGLVSAFWVIGGAIWGCLATGIYLIAFPVCLPAAIVYIFLYSDDGQLAPPQEYRFQPNSYSRWRSKPTSLP